jgi:2-methylcitrate dehydratase PrpD
VPQALCLKRYACHIVAHTPVFSAQRLRVLHDIDARRIASIRVEGAARLAANHDIKLPGDAVLAQYSVPFCVAAALLHDPDDPSTFGATLLDDPRVRSLAQRVQVVATGAAGLAATTRITLEDSTSCEEARAEFLGCPGDPLTRDALHAKFMRLTRRLGTQATPLFERLDSIESETDLRWLDAAREGERT